MLYSYHFDKTELRITIFINFQVHHRNKKNFESSYGFGDAISKLETFVWIWNHVSTSITWLLFNEKTPNLVK